MSPDIKQILELAEGRVLHMYLDTRGLVTCGVGHLLATAEAAVDLPFTQAGGAVRSTRESIMREWLNVKMMEAAHLPDYYAQRTNLRLADEFVDDLLDQDVSKARLGLNHAIDGFVYYPDPVQTALLDMSFNLGLSGLMVKYPKLIAACKWGEWRVAASECHRNGISETRNNETADLFRSLVAV